MNITDHPPPHIHVRYQDYTASVRIDDLRVYAGRLPPRVLGFVVEWATVHRGELMRCWNLARQRKPLLKIKPLE